MKTTITIPSNILRNAKRLLGRTKHLRSKLPLLQHLLLTAGPNGVSLAATDLDHWLETQVSDEAHEPLRFLIPPEAMDAACRADRGSIVAFSAYKGRRSSDLGITIHSGGIEANSVYPTIDSKDFPERPDTLGIVTQVPASTLEALAQIASCASNDTTRHILNGVLFTPVDGGSLVATDGKRLACCPASVPAQTFVLPRAACAILGHPDFTAGPAAITWIDHEKPEQRSVAIRCGRNLLVTTPLNGTYANYKQVIPSYNTEMAVIPHDRKPGLIAWLRALGKDQATVRLDWHKRDQLTLSHRDANGHSATMEVPVEIHGNPPVIAFHAGYLADALQIGSTLCLSDELTPGICRHPTGRFCVLMPMQLTIPATIKPEATTTTTTQQSQAAA